MNRSNLDVMAAMAAKRARAACACLRRVVGDQEGREDLLDFPLPRMGGVELPLVDDVHNVAVLPVFLAHPVPKSSKLIKTLRLYPDSWVPAFEEGAPVSELHVFLTTLTEDARLPSALLAECTPVRRGIVLVRAWEDKWLIAMQAAFLENFLV